MTRIAVFGAGAVGSFFGGMLARSGVPVTLIARQRHVDAILKNGLYLEGVSVNEHIRLDATTDVAAVAGADVVLFCVKMTATEDGAKQLAPYLKNGAIVLSLQNGLDNAERIRAATGIDAIATAVYVGAEMVGPGHVKHVGSGKLAIDAKYRSKVEPIVAMFERAGVPCGISEHMQLDLWYKFFLNVAYNAISAVTKANYGRVGNDPRTRAIAEAATREAVAVARASGVDVDESQAVKSLQLIVDVIPEAMSSTAQDIARGSRTEIDFLNGHVVALAAQHGLSVPVNQTLYALVKLLEEQTAKKEPVLV